MGVLAALFLAIAALLGVPWIKEALTPSLRMMHM